MIIFELRVKIDCKPTVLNINYTEFVSILSDRVSTIKSHNKEIVTFTMNKLSIQYFIWNFSDYVNILTMLDLSIDIFKNIFP